MDCWEQLGGVIGWEVEDPELAAVHFLTVASYNLQHPMKFTKDALEGLRIAVGEYLDRKATAADIRRRNSQAYDGSKRVYRDKAEWQPVLRTWQMTIADVYIPDRPQGAADRVRAWAAAICSEL